MRTRLLTITFIESAASILLERGFYFYSEYQLGYSAIANLAVALCFGAVYAGGAVASHPIAHRLGEKRTLQWSLAGLAAVHALLGLMPSGPVLVIGFVAVGLLTGIKWPVVESYVVAGSTPAQTLRVVGRFNVTWATAVPVGLVAAGWLVQSPWPRLLFFAATAVHMVSLLGSTRLPAQPTHLPHDHPERPPADRLARYRILMTSSRWAMLGSYVLLFLVVPLVPGVLRGIGLSAGPASAAASLMDVMRVLTFASMALITVWYGRPTPLILSLIALPTGAAMILFSGSLVGVLVGEVLFGVACGVCYFAALYYAMIVKNASVDAGGVHEGLIGAGFALGPIVGLVGYGLSNPMGGYIPGMLTGAGPLLLLLGLAALAPLRRLPARTTP